jgi:hypothetical protein
LNTTHYFSANKYSKLMVYFVMLLTAVLLSGCAYPNELRKENQANPAEFITVVQQAIDQFHTKTGLLPIKNSEMDTPLYEKYVIDFVKLQKGNFLSSIPINAFESGGIFMYMIVDAETKPTVKLMDLVVFQSAVDVQQQVDAYKTKNGSLPLGVEVTNGFHYVDFAKLGKKQPEIKSTYNRLSFISFLINDATGEIGVDYGPDLMKQIQAQALQSSLKPDQDLRELLVDNSYFVPARSFAYHWLNGQPVPKQS